MPLSTDQLNLLTFKISKTNLQASKNAGPYPKKPSKFFFEIPALVITPLKR